MAAAAAGGALAVVVPTLGVPGPPAAGAGAPVLQLATETAPTAPTGQQAGGPRMLASIVPVAHTEAPEPAQLQVTELIRAVGLADVARRAAAEQEAIAARAAAAQCDADLDGLGRVRPWVRDAARFLSCLHDEPTLIGVAQRSGASDHPTGRAVDLMTRGERGDRLAECALANRDELGISYVIWEQRVNHGNGWQRMEDRGGATANHFDHVHISFEGSAPSGDPVVDRCS